MKELAAAQFLLFIACNRERMKGNVCMDVCAVYACSCTSHDPNNLLCVFKCFVAFVWVIDLIDSPVLPPSCCFSVIMVALLSCPLPALLHRSSFHFTFPPFYLPAAFPPSSLSLFSPPSSSLHFSQLPSHHHMLWMSNEGRNRI